ncbi:MAG: molybdenum cofactor biosynthesis protein MoaE [Glaciihabitans sp.]|nr:molybdenum cofactor biosynthesis protein MoaE [Glaciihabitans sp.]
MVEDGMVDDGMVDDGMADDRMGEDEMAAHEDVENGASANGASAHDAPEGVAPKILARVTELPIDINEYEEFVMADTSGALVTFRGVIRNHDHGVAVSSLDYSAHPDAETFLAECCATVAAETGLRVAAAHRIGSLDIGDVALVASVAASHRAEAFAACERLVELIKSSVPIWKRQYLADGATEWVGI